MNEEISKKWLDRVAYDMETARAMLQTGRARYKEDLDQLSKGMSEAVVQGFIQFSEGLITWLCQKIK